MRTLTLHDSQSGSTARILPEVGFNCYAFRAAVGPDLVDVLHAEPGFENGDKRPSGSGIPILFPFPNRIRQGRFRWGDRSFELPAGDGIGNAIHGFVLDRPWRVTTADDEMAVGEFQLSVDAPDRVALWPVDFLIEVRYTLRGASLRADVKVVNAGEEPLPWGFGTHPYFSLPVGPRSHAADCLVQVPASESWELSGLLPTGKRLPVDARVDLRDGESMEGRKLDDVLTGVAVQQNRVQASVMDPAAGIEVVQVADEIFREWVVYTPPAGTSVCIEPYTCVTDAINLQPEGIDAGLQVLKPGAEFRTWIEICASPIYA